MSSKNIKNNDNPIVTKRIQQLKIIKAGLLRKKKTDRKNALKSVEDKIQRLKQWKKEL